jgi:hypothetical protein
MTHQLSYSNSKLDKAMNQEQFNQVVEAILAGKYSWACVLILRFAGYNPLHYIPYRTYNRLLKDNSPMRGQNHNQTDSINNNSERTIAAFSKTTPTGCLSTINDLAYLEVMGKQQAHVRGGSCDTWLEWTIEDSAIEDNFF